MSECTTCQQELRAGFNFCHFCGAPIGEGADSDDTTTELVQLVDKFKDLSAMYRGLASSAQKRLDLWLGSPISIQRQVLYALLSGFVAAAWAPLAHGVLGWLRAWLAASALFFLPVRYFLTGLMPLAGTVNAILGPELSRRRRLILSLALTALPYTIPPLLGKPADVPLPLSSRFSPPLEQAGATTLGFRSLQPWLLLAGSLLTNFYLMGFAPSWRKISGCGRSYTLDEMAAEAATISGSIRTAMLKRRISGLELTAIEMTKLQRFTAGESSGMKGEQISFAHGKARVVVFVQDLGTGLFVTWTTFYDASGRRLWLLIGFLVTFVDRLILRYFGSSPLEWSRQAAETLSPGTRHQVLLRSARGGFFSRTLRLVDGVSEYSWNEVYALDGAARETVITVLEHAANESANAAKIRAQIERCSEAEASFRPSASSAAR